jgi:hypothetical protein
VADLADVVTALAARLTAGMAGTTIGGRIKAFAPDTIDPPTAIVLPSQSDFVTWDRTFDGSDEFELVIKILMGSQDERTGQAELMSYFDRSGDTSLFAAIKTDVTLGGTVSFCSPLRGTAYGDVEWAGVPYFGAELWVECFT